MRAPGYALAFVAAISALAGVPFADVAAPGQAMAFGLVTSGIVSFLPLAVHQSMRLLAGIADLLMEQLRRK